MLLLRNLSTHAIAKESPFCPFHRQVICACVGKQVSIASAPMQASELRCPALQMDDLSIFPQHYGEPCWQEVICAKSDWGSHGSAWPQLLSMPSMCTAGCRWTTRVSSRSTTGSLHTLVPGAWRCQTTLHITVFLGA